MSLAVQFKRSCVKFFALAHGFHPTRSTKRFVTFTGTLWLAVMALPGWAATPGLPFTEDFSDSTLRDETASRAEWSTAEKAAYQKFLSQRNASDGAYDSSKNFGTGSDNSNVVIFGDVEGDGDLDIAIGQFGNQDQVYLYDSSTGTYGNPINFGQFSDSTTFALDFGDVDGDGDLDIAWGGSTGLKTSVWLYDSATGTYGNPIYINDALGVEAIKFADIDRDGDPDLVVGSTTYGYPETGPQNKVYFYDRDTGTYGNPLNFGPASGWTRALAVGDVDQDGDLDIAVGNGRFTTPYQNVLYLYNSSTDTYDTAINLGSSDQTLAISMGDVDGDGDLDIAVGNYARNSAGQNKLYLFDSETNSVGNAINIGDGGDQTTSLILGDMDEDGDLDAVVGNHNQQNAVYLYDKATGTFGNARSFGSGSDKTVALSLGDVDRDGDLDIAVGNGAVESALDVGQNAVYLYNSKADSFSGSGAIGAGANKSRTAELGDLDGDGDLDIVVGNIDEQNFAYFFDSDTSTFGNPVSFGPGGSSAHTNTLALGDVNGDGFLDVAAGNLNDEHRVYLYDDSSNSYPTSIPIDSPGAIQDLVFGDVDRDGDLDLAVAKEDAPDQIFFYNSLTGTFENPLTFGDSFRTSAHLGMADINGDGFLDIAVSKTNSTRHGVYFGDGEGGGFDDASSIVFATEIGSARDMELGDVDNDGDIDIAMVNFSGQNKVYLYNHLTGEYDSSQPFGSDNDSSDSLALGDVNGDGFLDIAVGSNGLSQGGGNIDPQNRIYFYNATTSSYDNGLTFGPNDDETDEVVLGDLDGDGDLDAVSINRGSGSQNRWYRYNGNSLVYASPRVFDTSNLANGSALACADMDNDGDMDIVAANGDDPNAVHIYDQASRTFAAKIPFGTPNTDPTALAVGDVDGDGDMDIVLGQYQDWNQVYLYNSTNGTYSSPLNFGTGNEKTRALELADVDRDGDLDAVVGNDGEFNFIYANDGNGVFSAYYAFGTGIDKTYDLAVGDIFHNGALDIAVGNLGEQNEIYFNYVDENGNWLAIFNIYTPWTFGTGTDYTTSLGIGDLLYFHNDPDLGNPDLVVGNFGNGGVAEQSRITANLKTFVFDWSTFETADEFTLSLDVGDVDHDGDPDILAGNAGSQNFVYRNNLNLGFYNAVAPIPVGSSNASSNSVALCDLDSDGDLDVALGGNSDDQIIILGAYGTSSQTIVSKKINSVETNLARVTLTATIPAPSHASRNTGLNFLVSNDGGNTWHLAHPGRAVNFTEFGSDLRWKAAFNSKSPATSPRVESVNIEENLLPFIEVTAQFLLNNFVALDQDENGALSLLESGLDFLAELKPYDTNNDGQVTLSDLQSLFAECIFKSGFEDVAVVCE